MIGARNNEAATYLQKQFSNRKAKKTYYAIVEGHPKLAKANLDLPIERNLSAPSTFRVGPNGKPAITTYEVIAESDEYSLIRLQPKTGRTHQLRVHMKYLNTPILGDRVYGKALDRLYLHAQSLEIAAPNSERLTFESDLPDDFKKYFPEDNL
jgi:23S rRNA pseudouridine1911/1915/1917 synthase